MGSAQICWSGRFFLCSAFSKFKCYLIISMEIVRQNSTLCAAFKYCSLCVFLCSIPFTTCAQISVNSLLLVTNADRGQLVALDTNTFSIQQTIALPFPVHERVWHSPAQRYAYLSSPDGWLIKFDLHAQKISQQIRVGLSTSGIALSHDGRVLMAANLQPATLVAMDTGNLSILRTIEVKGQAGKVSGVAAIHTASARNSFIAVMRDIPELWEISYDERAEPVYEGLVHDYKMGEAIALPGPFAPRKIILEQALSQFIFSDDFTQAMGTNDDGLMQVINLNIRRKIRELHFSSAVQADAAALWQWQGRKILALPEKNENRLNLIDMQTWQVLQKMAVEEGNYRLHTHAAARYVWISKQILDKRSLTMLPAAPPSSTTISAPLAWLNEGRAVVVKSHAEKSLLLLDSNTLDLLRECALPGYAAARQPTSTEQVRDQ